MQEKAQKMLNKIFFLIIYTAIGDKLYFYQNIKASNDFRIVIWNMTQYCM